MSHLKYVICLILVIFFTGCYEREMIIKINPDGSGIVTTTTNFDNATEDQRQQIKAMFNRPDSQSDYSENKMKKSFPTPHFEILEIVEDKETLNFKSTIKFFDINRLLAVDTQSVPFKGIDFKVEGEDLVFEIARSTTQSGFGPGFKLKKTADEFEKSIYPKETYRFIDAQTGNSIEFVHEYKGEETKKEISWEERLSIAGHTIQREEIKFIFQDYPVLPVSQGVVTDAAWSRHKRPGFSSGSNLSLKISVPFPPEDDFVDLEYGQIYLLSGSYSDGTPIEIDTTWHRGSQRFNDPSSLAGAGKFKLPLDLSFPKKPVKGWGPLKIRLQLLRGKDLKRVELGKLLPNHTYEHGPFKFMTKEFKNDELELEVKGPIGQLKEFSIKTKRGNIFLLKTSSWPGFDTHGSARFWKFLPLDEASVLVAFYQTAEYAWLDIDVPGYEGVSPTVAEPSSASQSTDLLTELFPEYQDFPEISEDIYKDKDVFDHYWVTLNETQIIPALLAVSYDMKRLKKYDEVYSHYQTRLGKTLKKREAFFEANKIKIAQSVFKLFLAMPDQNSNTAMIYLLSNNDLLQPLRKDALLAVKNKKLRNGIKSFFKGELSDLERRTFYQVFEKSDYWVESLGILKLLTQGEQGDLELAQRVALDESRGVHVRNSAFEALLDHGEDFSSSMLKSFLLDTTMRYWAMQAIESRLGPYGTQGQIPKEKLAALLTPIISVFEDLAEQQESFKRDRVVKILEKIKELSPANH